MYLRETEDLEKGARRIYDKIREITKNNERAIADKDSKVLMDL